MGAARQNGRFSRTTTGNPWVVRGGFALLPSSPTAHPSCRPTACQSTTSSYSKYGTSWAKWWGWRAWSFDIGPRRYLEPATEPCGCRPVCFEPEWWAPGSPYSTRSPCLGPFEHPLFCLSSKPASPRGEWLTSACRSKLDPDARWRTVTPAGLTICHFAPTWNY